MPKEHEHPRRSTHRHANGHADTTVLIGPLAAGKTTVGRILADRLSRAFVDIDDIAWTYTREVGWDLDRLLARDRAVGWADAEREWEVARAHALRRTVEDHPGAIIALGAAYTCYTDPTHARTASKALSQVGHVVHLRPSPDAARSVEVLRRRAARARGRDWIIEGHDFIAEWVAHPLNHQVATKTVYTEHDTPEQTGELLVRYLMAAERVRRPTTGSAR